MYIILLNIISVKSYQGISNQNNIYFYINNVKINLSILLDIDKLPNQ